MRIKALEVDVGSVDQAGQGAQGFRLDKGAGVHQVEQACLSGQHRRSAMYS